MFMDMLDALKLSVITTLSRVQIRTQEEIEQAEKLQQEIAAREQAQMQYNNAKNEGEGEDLDNPSRKIGRNEPCPCGSGKKYKHCHGSRARQV